MSGSRGTMERYFNRLWYSDQPPNACWRGLAHLYRGLAPRPVRPASRPPIPVVVVGNITVGGGGKTPVVAALAEHLVDAGLRTAIISRGHGGRRHAQPVLVSVDSDPRQVGDEPVLLARRTGCPVWTCRDRAAALQQAVGEGADVVLSDDGLQHHRLPRSFEICVIDGMRGLGNGHLLPAGPLRQPPARLHAVDRVLFKGQSRTAGLEDIDGTAFELEAGPLRSLDGSIRRPAEEASDRTWDAVCGIANPDSFFATLESCGIDFRRHVFPDHHPFRPEDLAALAGPIVVTEKDAVKLDRLDLGHLSDIWVLPVQARLDQSTISQVLAHVREFQPT